MQEAKKLNDDFLFKILEEWTSHLFLIGLYHHSYLYLDLDNLVLLIQEKWIGTQDNTSWPKSKAILLTKFHLYHQLLHKALYLQLINQKQQFSFGLLCIRIDMIQLDLFFDNLIENGFQGTSDMHELVLIIEQFSKQ
jgi:hypothetical protein